MADLTIARVEALACSVPLKHAVVQGLGQAVKRDTVLVKVTTADGLTGYGESYNGRAPLAVAQTVNTTLRDLLTGMDAFQTLAVWDRFESRVLANHGTGRLARGALPALPRPPLAGSGEDHDPPPAAGGRRELLHAV